MQILLIVLLILAVIIITRIRIVQQAKAYVIERLGAYKTTWGVGIHFLMPFIERVAKVVSLKEQVADFPPQPVITKDNVTMQIDTVVYFQVTDPKLFTYGIEQPMIAIENLSATTLRNIIGELELDECLTSRDVINTKMRAILDEATAFKMSAHANPFVTVDVIFLAHAMKHEIRTIFFYVTEGRERRRHQFFAAFIFAIRSSP